MQKRSGLWGFGAGRGIYIFLMVGVFGLIGAMLGAPAMAQGSEFTNATGIKVPGSTSASGKASPYPSGLTVGGLEGEITDVDVTLKGVSHGNPDDVDILLVSPGGANVLLMADSGGASNPAGANITLDDEATDSLPNSTLISSGSYKPTKSGSAKDSFSAPAPGGDVFGKTLSDFDGSDPNGEWKLYVVDDESGVGTVGEISGGYSLSIETTGRVEVNQPPVIEKVTVGSAREGVPVKVTVAATDADEDPLTYSFDCDSDGIYEVNGQDSASTECRYDEPGQKTVGVKVSDGTDADTETTRFTVENVAPVISGIEDISTNEDTPSAKADFTVTDAGEVTVSAASGDQRLVKDGNIDLRKKSDGGYEISATPEPDANGQVVITVTADDGTTTSTGEFTLSVIAVNDAPEFTLAGDEETDEDAGAQTVEDFVTGTSPGPEDESGQRVTVSVTGSTNAALFTDDGQPEIKGGTLTYTPKPNASGQAKLTVSATDDGRMANGGEDTAGERTFTITVNAVNDVPRAGDGSLTTDEDAPETINVFAGDAPLASDVEVERGEEGASLEVTSVTQGGNGSVGIGVAGDITYTPDEDYGGPDSFIYTVEDDGGKTATGTISVTVKPVNDAPAAVADTAETTEDTPVDIDVLENDTDADGGDELSVSGFTQPEDGSGTVTKNPDGTLRFTPKRDFSGQSTFTYTLTDGTTGETTNVTVTVTAVNDAPVAASDAYTVDEDGTLTANGQGGNPNGVLGNDTDPDGDPLTAKLIENVENGRLIFDATDGTFAYAPNAGFSGTDEFTYTAGDGTKDSEVATVGISVRAVNDAPLPKDDTKTTPENTPLVFPADDLTKNDSAGSGEDQKLTVTATGNARNGTVALSGGNITYTPNRDFNGEDSFTYTVCDDGEEPLCSEMEATVRVSVGVVNSAPNAADAARSTDEDQAITVDLSQLATDDETASKDLIYAVVSGPGTAKGTATIDGATLTYTPKKDFSGTATITYSATDEGDGDSPSKSDEGKLTITVNPVNDAPTADDDTASTGEDTPVLIDVLDGDTDPENDALTIAPVTQPGKGSVEVVNGKVRYTPNMNASGTDTFTYRVSDGEADSGIATVTVEVAAANDAPVGRPDSAKTKEDTSVNIKVLANDTDADADKLSVSEVSRPANGRVTARANGTIKYTPNANWSGTDTFTYRASDGTVSSDPVSVTVMVAPINDAPVVVDDAVKTPVNTPVRVAPLSNDGDTEGDALKLTSVRFYESGSVRVENGTFLFTPSRDFSGIVRITYAVSDGRGGQDTGTVTIRVGKKVK